MYIRQATEHDVRAILRLVNAHVRRGDLLPRTALSIRETLDDWLIAEAPNGDLAACVSLLYYTPALAEVRSLAVADEVKGQGYGRTILKALVEKARLCNVPTLFALTRAVGFFEKAGFSVTNKARFPEKVYRDCQFCPIQHACDETAVILKLSN
ncbi:MAG: GNAT family N-acetyltransferase [Ardenticatenaceae bacterium]|nr:GNAT family N-acetyltransferase [Anaerolineales bacterium]MCB8921760.1 GNAT family N-acetyltransferase [Ardenticatenaceae bacterium]MCB8990721.1 GNAT family N-acetyltransferase [Ardenticatenaceae bacterium]